MARCSIRTERAAASQLALHLLPPCPRSYNNAPPASEDFAKEPPIMPPHLQLTLLNISPGMDAQAVLPRPQHVILNHLYCQRGQVSSWEPKACVCVNG